MNDSVNHRKGSFLGTGFVAVAILAAVGLGWFAKRQPDESTPPPSGGVTRAWQASSSNIRRIVAGKGAPQDEAGKPIEFGTPYVYAEPAIWARVDVDMPPGQSFRRPNGLTIRIRDEQGSTWPRLETWRDGALFVTIPYGYSRRPRRLHLSVQSQDLMSAQTLVLREFDLPPLPPPRPTPRPTDSTPWPGLDVYTCHTQARLDNFVYVDAPLEPGEVLNARVVGGSGGLYGTAPKRVKDRTTPGQLNPLIGFSPLYLNTPSQIYVEVALMRRQRQRQRFRFVDLPIRKQYGENWVVGESRRLPFGSDAMVSLFGRDTVPFQAPERKRRGMTVFANVLGNVQNASIKLIGPNHLDGTPLRLSRSAPPAVALRGSGFRSGAPASWVTEKSNAVSVPIEIEVEAEILTVVKRKTVAVPFDPGHTRLIKAKHGKDVFVAEF